MELIDRNDTLEKMQHRRDYVGRPSDAVCIIKDAPIINITTCRECVFWYEDVGRCEYFSFQNASDEWEMTVYTNADDFCSKGERNEDD